jgi:hypothetical protein
LKYFFTQPFIVDHISFCFDNSRTKTFVQHEQTIT